MWAGLVGPVIGLVAVVVVVFIRLIALVARYAGRVDGYLLRTARGTAASLTACGSISGP
jgi:hypothetical protein